MPDPHERPLNPGAARDELAFLQDVADDLCDDPAVIMRLSLRILHVLDAWRAGRPAAVAAQGALAAAATELAFTIYE